MIFTLGSTFMNQLLRSNAFLWHPTHRVLRAQLYSTNAQLSSSSSASIESDSLYRRISRAGHPAVSIIPVIEKWLEEGKGIDQSELRKLIKQLRKYRRFNHAFQISQWMADQRGYNLSAGDVAIQLDLILKVQGLRVAEEYFNRIPDASRGHEVYGALLHCYAHTKQLEKAESLMQKMKELGLMKTALPYNLMLNLYSQIGKYEKLDILMLEMEEKGIRCDIFTFNIRMHAYVASSDIEGMEKLLLKIETDPKIRVDFHAYVVAANGYLKAGLVEKALMMLKKSEHLISGDSKRSQYEIVLTIYASAGKKDELYRVWNLYKNTGRSFNTGYITMISSLAKLNDVEGAERILEEWDSEKTSFDIRIPNLMISLYSRKHLWEKAEVYLNKIIERGMEPDATSWDHLAAGYCVGGQMTKAVEAIKKAISISKPGWKPSLHTVESCLEYLKGQGDVGAAEELFKLIKEQCHFSRGAFDRLCGSISNGTFKTDALDQMEGNDQTFGREPPTALELTDKGST